jgi:hypothetical protein
MNSGNYSKTTLSALIALPAATFRVRKLYLQLEYEAA